MMRVKGMLTGRRSEDGVSDFKVTVYQPWLV